MDKSVLQIPMSKELRLKAEQVALSEGFSSLQEYIRVFLSKIASKELGLYISKTPVIQLSDKVSKTYSGIESDYLMDKNITSAKSVDDLIDTLNEAD